MSDQPGSWISLGSPELSARINPLGAQLSILRDRAGRDLLWDGNPAVWNGRAPLLFPIVGSLAGGAYRLGTRTYQLPRHGFARGKPFEVASATPTAAAFTLRADESTLQVYPFHFELGVDFALQGASLTVTATVRNLTDAALPASFGFHPAFRWPLPYEQARAAHFIEFAQDEPTPIRRLNSAGLVAPGSVPTPVADRVLPLADALFAPDVVIFDQVRSRSVTYGAQVGPRIRVSYPDAPYLGIWSKPGAPFVCIEPWHGISDPEGFTGDFSAKPGVFSVPPGGAQSVRMEITLLSS